MSKYVDILFRHRLRFLLLLVVLPLDLAMSCIFLFPHQTAAASLWVDTPAYISVSAAATGWNQYLTPAQNTQDALDQLWHTGAFVNTLAVDLDAQKTFRDGSERSSSLSTLDSDLKSTVAGSHLVILTYICPHQPICTNVLADSVQIYRDWLAERQSAQARVAIDFYTGQLNDAQAKLQADEAALNQYLSAHPNLKPADAPLIPEFDQLLRNVDQDRVQVAALQQKLDTTRLTDAAAAQIDSTVLKLIDPPHLTGGQLSSLPRKQMVIAAVASFALGIAVLVAMAWLDRTVREARELESRLGLRVVTTIPDLAMAGGGGG